MKLLFPMPHIQLSRNAPQVQRYLNTIALMCRP
jgi:hypothetical protein